jgi:hypothetical protein
MPRFLTALSFTPAPGTDRLIQLSLMVLLAVGWADGSLVGAQAPITPQPLGQPYRQVRARLIRSGWTYSKEPRPGECAAVIDDRRCFLFPELGSCSLTGLGLCRFNWTSPQGRQYAIITSGGDPSGDPGIVSDLLLLP